MKLYRKGIVIIIFAVMMTLFSGCSAISLLTQGEFDAGGYVQGIMDSTYKAEFDKYIELTEDTQENAQVAYDSVMNTKAEAFATYTAVTLTDDSKPKFIDYSKQIYKNAKYEISKTTKTEDGFIVDVVISPMTILKNISTEGEAYVTEFNARNADGEFADLTQEDFEAAYADGIMSIFENNISNIQYSEDVTVTVSVSSQDNKVYTMDAKEFEKIDNAILQQ
ncbi:MAG: DUF3568 family protein [Lachnotalea sp.]